MRRWTALALALLSACAELPPADAPRPPEAAPTPRVAPDPEAIRLAFEATDAVAATPAAPSLAPLLGLLVRGGAGPLAITMSRAGAGPWPEGSVVPSSAWRCAPATIVDEPGHAAFVLSGCRVDVAALPPGGWAPTDAEQGEGFDVAVHLEAGEGGEVFLRPELENRMQVGLSALRVVLRFPEALVPAGEATHLLFGVDEWIPDPVASLVAENRAEHSEFFFYWLPEPGVTTSSGGPSGFYPEYQSARPLVSVHAPAFAAMIHLDDPENLGSSQFLVGSNEGALELAHDWHLPGELRAGNGVRGLIDVGARLRLEVLPNARPSADGYWETVARYRAYAERTGMIAARPMIERAVPAAWADDCVYTVLSLGAATDGSVADPTGSGNPAPAVVDLETLSALFEGFVDFYAPEGQRHFCPLLWGWSAIGPYSAIEGFDELLARWRQIAADRGVEVHPWAYMHPSMVSHAAFGTELEDAMLHDLAGRPFTWDDPSWDSALFLVDPGHETFRAHLLDTARALIARGVEGIYFDNPFFLQPVTRENGGIDVDQSRAIAELVRETVAILEESGGGVVACERQRMGLPTSYGAGGGGMPRARSVPVTHALVHDLELVSGFGDFAIESITILGADPEYVPMANAIPDAAEGIFHYGVRGAAWGASAIHLGGVESWAQQASPGRVEAAMVELYTRSVRSGQRARREHDALRTGRMLPTPAYETPMDTVYRRGMPSFLSFTEEVYPHPTPRFSAGFFESLERPGVHALAVGNPSDVDVVVPFELRVADYPSLAPEMVLAGPGEALTPLRTETPVWSLTVTVPARSVAVVELLPAFAEDE